MTDVAIGVSLMLALFAVLLGGMLLVTRVDESEVDPGDATPAAS